MWEQRRALLISKLEDGCGDVCAFDAAGMPLVLGHGWHPRGEERFFGRRGSSMWVWPLLIVLCVCMCVCVLGAAEISVGGGVYSSCVLHAL